MEEQNLFIGDVKILVVDEADTLFDEGFGPEVEKLMSPILARGGQVVLVTATLSKARKYLSSVHPPNTFWQSRASEMFGAPCAERSK